MNVKSEAELLGQAVTVRQIADLAPRGILDRHAVLAPVQFLLVLDLTGIEHFGEALRQWGRFQVLGELRHLLLERSQITECCHVEYGDETPVIMPSARFYTETKPGQQTRHDFDNGSQAGALVTLGTPKCQHAPTHFSHPG